MVTMYGARPVMLAVILALVITGSAMAASTTFWTKTANLYQGGMAVFQIEATCGTQVTLSSPYGSNFDLYAMKTYGGSCPSANYVKTHYSRISARNGMSDSISLEAGTWCVMIYARSGSGQFILEGQSSCPSDPCYGDPCCGDPCCGDPCCGDPCCGNPCPPSCSPYRTNVKTGFISEGSSKVYGFPIGGDRTLIEWVLTGPCGNEIPVVMMGPGDVSSMRSAFCGPDFDLYIYKDCDPRYYACTGEYADISEGTNAYVAIPYPETGSTYYAEVFAKSGAGEYMLTVRSYTCSHDVDVMMAQPDLMSMMYTAAGVVPP